MKNSIFRNTVNLQHKKGENKKIGNDFQTS